MLHRDLSANYAAAYRPIETARFAGPEDRSTCAGSHAKQVRRPALKQSRIGLPVLRVSPPRQQTWRYTVRARHCDRRSDMHGCSTKRSNRRAVARHAGVSPCFKRRRPLKETPRSGGTGADFSKALASNLSTKSLVMPAAICIQSCSRAFHSCAHYKARMSTFDFSLLVVHSFCLERADGVEKTERIVTAKHVTIRNRK